MNGSFLIGSRAVTRSESFRAIEPATGEALAPDFSVATADDVADACALPDAALGPFSGLAPEERARFLEAVASAIEALGDALVNRAMAESGLPAARLTGERGRTTGQLRLFARVLREGHWAGVVLAPPLPDRQPLPRADLRRRNVAVAPVAVFDASNFPLAFSVAGGDAASAFAAGCPVVCKAHPAHAGTSAMVAEVPGCRPGVRLARGRVLAAAGTVQRTGRCAGRGTPHRGGGTHRQPRGRARTRRHRRASSGADPGLCRDVERQPGGAVPRGTVRARGIAGDGLCRLADTWLGPVLHQFWCGARAGRARPRSLHRRRGGGDGGRAVAGDADAGDLRCLSHRGVGAEQPSGGRVGRGRAGVRRRAPRACRHLHRQRHRLRL